MDERISTAASLLILTVGSFAAFWFSEWVFVSSQLSFLDGLSLAGRMMLFATSLAIVVVPLALVLVGGVLVAIAPDVLRKPLVWSVLCVPVAIQSWTLLLLVDNFTYTLFGLGLMTVGDLGLWAYRLGLAFLFVYLLRHNASWVSILARLGRRRILCGVTLGLVFCSVAGLALKISGGEAQPAFTLSPPTGPLPNILFLASDGVPAERLSVYGFESDTTPFLRSFKDEALFISHAYTNSSHTFASTTSMLTGKSPFAIKTFFRYKPLRGRDAWEHLPGILNQLGYTGIQVADRVHANSVVHNMKGSFRTTYFVDIDWIPPAAYDDVNLGLYLFERAQVRVRKLVGGLTGVLARMIRARGRSDAEALAASPAVGGTGAAPAHASEARSGVLGDQVRVDALLAAIPDLPKPFYAHVHLSDTHVSHGNSVEYLDGRLRESDRYVEQIVAALAERELLDDTIVIINSDHSRQRHAYERVPLMIRFPDEAHAGVVDRNVQLLDLAPTLLDYLGQPIPEWMTGASLLADDQIEATRLLFGFGGMSFREDPPDGEFLVEPSFEPALGTATLLRCNEWYYYSIRDRRLLARGRGESADPACSEATPLGVEEATALIEEFLAENGVGAEDMPPASAALLP